MQKTDSIFRNARRLISLNKLEKAKLLLQPLIIDRHDDYKVYSMLGLIYHMTGNFEKAIRNYKQALEINNKETETMINLGMIYNDTGDYVSAKRLHYVATEIIKKNNLDIHHESKQNIQEIDKMFALQHIEIAKLYIRYQRYDNALHELEKAKRLNKNILNIPLLTAECYHKTNKKQLAITTLSEAKKQNDKMTEIGIKLGHYLFLENNTAEAIQEWESVLKHDPKNIEAKHFLNISNNQENNKTLIN